MRPSLECLEERTLLSAVTAAQIRQAYGIDQITYGPGHLAGDGSGQIIAIIDSGFDANIVQDLQTFDTTYSTAGLDLSTFGSFAGPVPGSTKPWFNQVTAPGSNPQSIGDKAQEKVAHETSLDVEAAHAIAPGANILLVQTDQGESAIAAAAQYAATLPGVSVVSISYGFAEQPSDPGLNADFTAPAVTFVASAGDSGGDLGPGGASASVGFPAVSPDVVAVGGTSLTVNADGSYAGETAWSFPAPSQTLTHGGTGYTQAGGWTNHTGGFSGTYATMAAGTGTATWVTTIGNADQTNKNYTEVAATWVAAAGNATNATYQVYDGDVAAANLVATVTVDQTQAPVGTAVNGSVFQELGNFQFQNGKVTVVLSAAGANGKVVADAVAVAKGGATGGGISTVEARPAFQNGVMPGVPGRSIPDVAFDADPATGLDLVDTYNPNNVNPSHRNMFADGGTSLAAPCWAGLVAIADQIRAAAGQAPLGTTETLFRLYNLPSEDFHDVTAGYNGRSAGPGYDLLTGLGSPVANMLVNDLAGFKLFVVGPTTLTAGEPATITLFATDGLKDRATAFPGTVHFSSGTDPRAVLPADFTFAPPDAGTHSFTLTLGTPGTQTVTLAGPLLFGLGETFPVTVLPAPIALTGMQVAGPGEQPYQGPVATFTDPDTLARAGDFSATIVWGDGTNSAGTVVGSAPSFEVLGSHAYAQPGAHAVTVIVSGDGATATAGGGITGVVSLPGGASGTPDQRFVTEALEDLLGAPPTLAQVLKDGRHLKANHAHFVTTLLQTPSLLHRFLLNEAGVLYAALTGHPAAGGLVHRAVSELQAGESPEKVARKWAGAAAAVLDQALVGALTEQFLGRPATAGDVALYGHFLKHGGKEAALAAALVGSAEYGALASA